jgi:uncharacterized protein
MKFIVLFEDNPQADPNLRRKFMPEHLAFLERNADKVKAAGPLTAQNNAPAGGLWIVDTDDAASVTTLVHQDPLWPTGLRKSVQILIWTQVFTDGQRLISA